MSEQENFTIRRSRRAKRARIVVTAEKVELVAPVMMPEKLLRQFVANKQQWISETQKKIRKKTSASKLLFPKLYAQGSRLLYLDKYYALTLKFTAHKQIEFKFNQALLANIPKDFQQYDAKSLSDLLHAAYIDWLKQQALQKVMAAVDIYSPLYQLHAKSIRVRAQKSRWGSCGVHNDIYMNWLLILAPIEVLDYVVIHEICHIAQRNHSAKFWGLVALHCPSYKKHRLWLKQHGTNLILSL